MATIFIINDLLIQENLQLMGISANKFTYKSTCVEIRFKPVESKCFDIFPAIIIFEITFCVILTYYHTPLVIIIFIGLIANNPNCLSSRRSQTIDAKYG